jgi:hypothetical protein
MERHRYTKRSIFRKLSASALWHGTDFVPDLTPQAEAWRKYRWWSRAFWVVFLGFLPGMALVDRLVRAKYGDAADAVTPFVAFAWMLAFAATGYVKGNFDCPCCGQTFFRAWDDRPWRKSWRSNPFARRCLHCGLPKWSAGADASR